MGKILSIIIPTYNMENYLRKCLDSLIVSDVNMNALEVLVINDGSKDFSSRIAHEYETKYLQTFRVIDKDNGNYGSCVNRGLKEMTGKYVKVLDADDYFATDSLDSYIEFLRHIDADLVISPYVKVNEARKVINSIQFIPSSNKTVLFSDEQVGNTIFSKHFQMHAVTYKTQIFKSLNYIQSEGISYTDQEWMFTPLTQVKTIAYFNKTLYYYLLGRKGQTMDMGSQIKQVGHHMQGTLKMLKDYNRFSVNKEVNNYLTHRLNRRVSEIFKICMLYDLPYEKLHIFDSEIKAQNLAYYNQLDNIVIHKYFPYHFIRNWHHQKKSVLFDIYKILKKFVKTY